MTPEVGTGQFQLCILSSPPYTRPNVFLSANLFDFNNIIPINFTLIQSLHQADLKVMGHDLKVMGLDLKVMGLECLSDCDIEGRF